MRLGSNLSALQPDCWSGRLHFTAPFKTHTVVDVTRLTVKLVMVAQEPQCWPPLTHPLRILQRCRIQKKIVLPAKHLIHHFLRERVKSPTEMSVVVFNHFILCNFTKHIIHCHVVNKHLSAKYIIYFFRGGADMGSTTGTQQQHNWSRRVCEGN